MSRSTSIAKSVIHSVLQTFFMSFGLGQGYFQRQFSLCLTLLTFFLITAKKGFDKNKICQQEGEVGNWDVSKFLAQASGQWFPPN
jgi:hypothetical protein